MNQSVLHSKFLKKKILDDSWIQFKSVSDETTIISEIPAAPTDIEEATVVTPSEGKQPVSLLGDEFCEELAHPHLFLESLARKIKGKYQLA